MTMKETKEEAIKFVENGGKCLKQFGFSFKGARGREITTEEAKQKLATERGWEFGKGFYELEWVTRDGETYLKFTEYSESDMW